jgi:hypothetical protein
VLEDWIKEKKYLQAVTVKQGAPIAQLVENMGEEKELQDTEYERCILNKTNRIYLCPRDIQYIEEGGRPAVWRAKGQRVISHCSMRRKSTYSS